MILLGIVSVMPDVRKSSLFGEIPPSTEGTTISATPDILDSKTESSVTNTSPATPNMAERNESNLILYDDFNDSANNGSYNQSLWQIHGEMCLFVQQDGIIKIENLGKVEDTCELYSQGYENLPLESTSTFEARLMLDAEGLSGIIHFSIESKDLSGETWTSHCDINSVNSDIAHVDCVYSTLSDVGNPRYVTKHVQTEQRTWHKFRIEIHPDAMELIYYLDDQMLGSYRLKDANSIIHLNNFWIILNRRESQGFLTGYADDVRISINE